MRPSGRGGEEIVYENSKDSECLFRVFSIFFNGWEAQEPLYMIARINAGLSVLVTTIWGAVDFR